MAAMLRSSAMVRALRVGGVRRGSTLRRGPLWRQPLSQRVPEPMEFIYKHWEDLTPAAANAQSIRAAVKAEAKEEETESQKWERVRKLIQKHLEENPMPMSPVSAYYVLRRDLFEIMENDASSHAKPLKLKEKKLRPRRPGEKNDLPSGHGRSRLGTAGAPMETRRSSGRRSAKQSKLALPLQRLQSQQSPLATATNTQDAQLKEAAETKPEEKAADESQDLALKEAAETKPEEKAADESQDLALKEAAETKPEEKAADESQDPALKEAAEAKPEEKAADKSQDPALKEAAETKPEEKAADKSQDLALKEAAETKPEEKAADESQDPALKGAPETKPEEKAADKSQDLALKEAAETKPEEKAADESQDPALKEAAEAKPEEKAADESQDPALKEAAETKPEEKAADESQELALKEAAETKPEEKAADERQDPALKEAPETKPEEKAADESQDLALKEAAETKPEEKAADESQDLALKEAAETEPEGKAADKSQALASEDTEAKPQRSHVKKGKAGRTARRQQAATQKVLAILREQQLQGDYAKFNEFVLDRLASTKSDSSIFSDFIRVYQEERYRKKQKGLRDRLKRKNVRKSFGSLNRGYEEPEEEYEAEEEEFKDEWRDQSILEDFWKAEQYRALHQRLREDLPERELLAAERTDRVADVLRSAFCKEYADQHRPVLTHELADYENPYMLKRSAMERLLHERCVRNQLDERVMPRLLDQHPDLVKLRRQAALPPEALEPLAAFRGDVRWHFDARERLEQKLQGVDKVLEVIEAKKKVNVDQLQDALPEKRAENPPENQLEGVRHPWRNHLGFESAVPRGVAGGIKFGQPEPELSTQLAKMRYPTLQRVAHTLPKDPKYRAHVVRSIRVLERSKDWDFQSKLDAINRMKEIYDTMKDSQEYMSGLDEKLVVNRVPSHIKRKYAKDVQYVKTFPKMWYKKKSFFRYRPSLTATAPLGKKKK